MRVLLVFGLSFAVAACGSDSGPAKPSGAGGETASNAGSGGMLVTCSPELDTIAVGLFATTCVDAGCHSGEKAAAALELSGEDLAARLIGQAAGTCDGWKLVSPGKPEESLLLKKLEGKVPTDCGDPMPPGASSIAPEQIACVRDWIASLSLDAGTPSPNACETCGGAACVDLAADVSHCGACDEACPAGAACIEGKCDCPSSLLLCDARCVDTTSDPQHCADCGGACARGELCNGGSCECGPGLDTCKSGCAELLTDPQNCGGCDIACGPGKLCTPTGCGTQADCVGLTRCTGACVDTDTSLMHCGGCNMPCGAGETCSNGSCACPAGSALCNGACVDTSADSANCGSCGNACPDGTSCNAGACECPGGGASCGADCVDLKADAENCGRCGNVCAPGQTCDDGQCSCSNLSVSFSADVAPVLNANCTNAGCHSGVKAKEGLDLTLSKSYADLVGVKASQCNDGRLLVKAGVPSESYLVQKLLGVNMCGGTQMPKAGTSLPDADLEAVTAWICQGAPK